MACLLDKVQCSVTRGVTTSLQATQRCDHMQTCHYKLVHHIRLQGCLFCKRTTFLLQALSTHQQHECLTGVASLLLLKRIS